MQDRAAYKVGYGFGLALSYATLAALGLIALAAVVEFARPSIGVATLIGCVAGLCLAEAFKALEQRRASRRFLGILRDTEDIEAEEEEAEKDLRRFVEAAERKAEEEQAEWIAITIDDHATLNFMPVADLIAHEPKGGCVCKPTLQMRHDDGGLCIVIYLHMPLDGRPVPEVME